MRDKRGRIIKSKLLSDVKQEKHKCKMGFAFRVSSWHHTPSRSWGKCWMSIYQIKGNNEILNLHVWFGRSFEIVIELSKGGK